MARCSAAVVGRVRAEFVPFPSLLPCSKLVPTYAARFTPLTAIDGTLLSESRSPHSINSRSMGKVFFFVVNAICRKLP